MSVMTAPAREAAHINSANIKSPLACVDDAFVDPLDEDCPTDDVIVTTRRAIARVALVATEAGARFQREGVRHDPMTWMLAPRTLFAGAPAVKACLHRDACLRGILLHGLSLGLDADPAAIDALADGDEDAIDFTGAEFESSCAGDVGGDVAHVPGGPEEEPRLFTATVVARDGFETIQAFHASLAVDETEIASRLYMRMGAAMADAVIVDGFDPTAPLVGALVAPALCDTLSLIAADPASPLAAGLDLNVEQRFLG